MSIPARCMAIADIFEALTAKDRPYKKGKSLSESLYILGKMKLNNHIDPDLFNIFIWSKVYEEYARRFMETSQIDIVDLSKIPGYEIPLEH
jgi:HD-GYP domain-containing protein (c-di-GMP phosphodiesterase class II)